MIEIIFFCQTFFEVVSIKDIILALELVED